jgi:predicted nucleic acid-binding protein
MTMIVLDTNVLSEEMRDQPTPAVHALVTNRDPETRHADGSQ